jgi:hypothetical protein
MAELPIPELVLATIAGMIILVMMVIILWVKLNKLRTSYLKVINGGTVGGMEELLERIQGKQNNLDEEQHKVNRTIQAIKEQLSNVKGNVGIVRYNALGDHGSDLSFSIAILNSVQDGVVITGIHNREQTYVYAKPVNKGQSAYSLSPEEKEAMAQSFEKERQLVGSNG